MERNVKLVISLVSLLIVHLCFAVKIGDAQTLPAACASANVTDPQSKRPIGFLTGREFLNNASMTTVQEVRTFLQGKKSWLQGDPKGEILDVDGTKINIAQLVFDAAADPIKDPNVSKRPINPQLLLTMIEKESGQIKARTRPPTNDDLALLTGCGNPSTMREQIQCAARSLRNRFDELAKCGDTINGWNLKNPKVTQDGINITPTNAATVANFAYNPLAGKRWGGNTKYGANALFCILWHSEVELHFAQPPTTLTLSPQNPMLTCSDPVDPVNRRNVTFSVAGGTPPYRWTTVKMVYLPLKEQSLPAE